MLQWWSFVMLKANLTVFGPFCLSSSCSRSHQLLYHFKLSLGGKSSTLAFDKRSRFAKRLWATLHTPLQEGPPPLQFLDNPASVQTSRRSGHAGFLLRSASAPPSSWCKTRMEFNFIICAAQWTHFHTSDNFHIPLLQLFGDLDLLDEASGDETNSGSTLPHL